MGKISVLIKCFFWEIKKSLNLEKSIERRAQLAIYAVSVFMPLKIVTKNGTKVFKMFYFLNRASVYK